MKQRLAAAALVAVVFSLVACGNDEVRLTQPASSSQSTSPPPGGDLDCPDARLVGNVYLSEGVFDHPTPEEARQNSAVDIPPEAQAADIVVERTETKVVYRSEDNTAEVTVTRGGGGGWEVSGVEVCAERTASIDEPATKDLREGS